MGALDKQVYIYSLGTESFYTDKEYKIHNEIMKLHIKKKELKSQIDEINSYLKKPFKKVMDVAKDKGNEEALLLNIELMMKQSELKELRVKYKEVTSYINMKKDVLKNKFNKFKGIRKIRNESLTDNKIIGIFDSALSRTIDMKIDEKSTSLFVVRAYYFNILENIINDGFLYNGEKYIYFSSSAGQIRTKKTVFIKKSLWEKYENTLTCGLSLDKINELGGCNVNKYLAYKALTSSASEKWNGFDINKAIVVPDLSSAVTSEFDYIDRNTYEITRKTLTVDIEHTDGCGMILPRKSRQSKKSFMCRLPFVKGLLVPQDFRKFAIEVARNTKVKDIYGKVWDIVEDDIQIIFTKSQFKMAKYYKDWQEYKDNFVKYNCSANKLNLEDISGDAKLNYQMIQTLTDITDDELQYLCESTNEDIKNIHHDKETILRVLGATENNKNKNYFQQGLMIYPELINDNHSRRIIKNKKDSMINDARAGKLNINGKYLYLVPDLYAFCEFLFQGNENPRGLLKDNEVYTSVFNEGEVDILRSPHLYKEHAVRNVVKDEELSNWFITNGIYTSVHDPISRILQFDK